ncbi:MAG: Ferrous-iron efflux pump FieF [Chroococcidiopsis cubana SAG 39.79]|uniref:Transporter n=1 Tax=Chroococcidiopsis cubana SAG 39.79 TaxID=388085 RepID=A0AB37US18_9CYAN|nr:cation diffusion facilitator family transporter [Chroococcidiopsis cubana]MDZ4877930.1 Ferrous-iron efflux pump FieF [Chroococcidiopsis cubana SAG 39.79]PSB66360.1 cation-efflux pump [Chroococcidiopsis cubana CCALA 043]RUT14194.1 transporter [Chroococcidiopsis cubana SAG 39.79]
MRNSSARFYAFLSIGAAVLTIALKAGAYFLTGSVGLLSDVAESGVNLVAALVATWALTYAAKPPDEEHAFGHSKAEYFSSGVEGALILVAAVSIAVAAWERLLHPQPLAQIGIGLGLSLVATAVNGGLALVLLRAGRRLRSITLRADAHHLLTDDWTSVGVVLGLIFVPLTGWLVLDPVIAFLVAANIIWTGVKLLSETGSGLLDASMPAAEQRIVTDIFASYEKQGIQFHAFRTRVAGVRRFVSFHVLVPGNWSVQQGHALCEEIELAILRSLPQTHVLTHLEPLEDPISWSDQNLDRTISPQ